MVPPSEQVPSPVITDFGRIMLTTLLCAARLAGVSACE